MANMFRKENLKFDRISGDSWKKEKEKRDEGMKIFACWKCKEFGHFLSSCLRRLKKTKSSNSDKSRINKDCTCSSDEEFDAALEEFLSDR